MKIDNQTGLTLIPGPFYSCWFGLVTNHVRICQCGGLPAPYPSRQAEKLNFTGDVIYSDHWHVLWWSDWFYNDTYIIQEQLVSI